MCPATSLSVVVITKLPFGVPSDPIISARSELYEDSFNEYYLPESILKFRQGFGRLIRTASDHGDGRHLRQARADQTIWKIISGIAAPMHGAARRRGWAGKDGWGLAGGVRCKEKTLIY